MTQPFRLHTFAFFLLSALLLLLSNEATCAQSTAPSTHRVQAGETLYSVARTYEVSVADLREWNDLSSDELSIGQSLRVRPPASDETTEHVVQAGETLFSIGREYNVTLAELQEWNRLESTLLSPGQRLRIYPTESENPTPPDIQEDEPDSPVRIDRSLLEGATATQVNSYYTVRSGDNLGRIANAHDMSVRELRELNDLSGDVIRVGQRLIVRQESQTPIRGEASNSAVSQGRFDRHRVSAGDSLPRILEQYQMSRDELQSLNPGMDLDRIREGQQLTVLVPPERNFRNPYRDETNLENLGEVPLTRYEDTDRAQPTSSGELYSPDLLTAAHASISLGQVIYVEHPQSGLGVYVKINDRTEGDGLRLSGKAFQLLGLRDGQPGRGIIYQEL
ncbi:MAG: LysM peptidoglycan-binding domain-containing protein [Balneolaceae bacterium]